MTTEQSGQLGTNESRGVGKSGAGQGERSKPSYDDLLSLARTLAYVNLDGERDDVGHTFHADLVTEYETLTALVTLARDVLRMDDPPLGARPCDCDDCQAYLTTGIPSPRCLCGAACLPSRPACAACLLDMEGAR